MNMMLRLVVSGFLGAALSSVGLGAQEASPPSQSADAAHALTALLDAQGLQAFAAGDPASPGRFVAALYVKGAELLVVSGTYPVPSALEKRLKENQYREIYIDLQSTASANDRFFVEDLQANGLRAACGEGEPFDIVSENGAETRFNDHPAGRQLTEGQYRVRFTTADAKYAHMLSVLIARLRPTT